MCYYFFLLCLPIKLFLKNFSTSSRLQKFKLNIANTVITQDNSSLHSMDTSQLLGLFTVDSGRDNEKKKAGTSKNSSMKAIMEDMEELWDDKQYDDEYNLDNFMGTLKQ